MKEDAKKLVRNIDLSLMAANEKIDYILSADTDMKMMSIKVPKEYDLVRTQRSFTDLRSFTNLPSKSKHNNFPPRQSKTWFNHISQVNRATD